MQLHNRIFSDKYLDAKAAELEIPEIDKKLAIIADWQKGIVSGRIARAKEEQLQSDFLQRFFGDILEYDYSKGLQQWNLDEEQKTLIDASKMDGALGFFSIEDVGNIISDIRVVIELKDARTDLDSPQHRKNDRRTPVQQAFDYANAVGGTCRWVIVSDFVEIRLYFHNDRSRYESFDIRHLDRPDQFRRFWLLLHKQRLIAEKGESFSDKLYVERQQIEATISKQFYNEYKQARLNLFHHLKAENPNIDELSLLSKTQKLLDRILFVCFCEDVGIIPPYILRNLIDLSIGDRLIRSDVRLYPRLRALFDAVNKGFPEENINKFNGGLFADDEILNHLIIKDSVIQQIASLKQYDFASDLNVNILGHIFEQSVSDIEELKAEIAGQPFDKKNGKRKKDGIYYTPEYITRYIVEQAVGGWLADRKAEIGFDKLPELSEQDYQSIRIVRNSLKTNENVRMHIQAYQAYREKLKNIKVLDPACGSGAFLNQAFDFLYKEGQRVNQILARLKAGQHEVFDLSKDILTNNIFGVDLNVESVEITKLSLWLKTANKSKELTTLDHNIRCGNSLIDDPAVAGEKAFDWTKEFPEIMANGGFDVVVGNPPYGATLDERKKSFLIESYQSFNGNFDIYTAFIELAFRKLSSSGFWGFITPVSWQSGFYYQKVREFLKENGMLIIGLKLPYDVFEDAYVDTGIYIVKKEKKDEYQSLVYEFPSRYDLSSKGISNEPEYSLPCDYWQKLDSLKIVLNPFYYELLEKIRLNSDTLIGNITNSVRGILANSEDISDEDIGEYRKFFSGSVYRYICSEDFQWIRYGDNLKEKPKEYSFFKGDRILIRRLISRQLRIMATFVEEEFVSKKDLYNLKVTDNFFNIKYLLCCINSRLVSFILTKGSVVATKDDFSQLTLEDIREIPIKNVDHQKPFTDKADIMLSQNKALSALRNDFLNFVKNELKPQKISTKLEHWHELDWDGFKKELAKGKVKLDDLSLKKRKEWQDYFLEHQAKAIDIKAIIDKTDCEIDRMVYALYGLTDEEIRIVEG